MQYLLTAEEYRNHITLDKHLKELQALTDKLLKAEKMVMETNNFVCIHGDPRPLWEKYCDDCPLGINGINTCQLEKNYSQ